MPETRKRKNEARSKLDLQNDNSNHAASSDSQRLETKQNLPKKGKSVVKASFNEDDEFVEMEAEGNITCDGEIDSEVSDGDNDNSDVEHETSSDQVVDETQEFSNQSRDDHDVSPEVDHRIVKKWKKQEKERHRASMEAKLDSLTSSLQVMQDLMVKKGIIGEAANREKQDGKEKQLDDMSETTVYCNAVLQLDKTKHVDQLQVDREISFKITEKRDSSSSEDRIDTSDELMEIEDGFNETKTQQTNIDPEKFIVECMERAKIEKANMSVRRGQGSSANR